MFNPPLEGELRPIQGELGYGKRGICWALAAPPISPPPFLDGQDLSRRKGFISRTEWARLDGLELRWGFFKGKKSSEPLVSIPKITTHLRAMGSLLNSAVHTELQDRKSLLEANPPFLEPICYKINGGMGVKTLAPS